MACLAITGAMKSTLTAAMEVLLNLTPLNLLIMAEARTLYRLLMLKQPADLKTETGLLSIWKNVSKTTQFQYITTPKFSMSSSTWTIGETKIQSSLRTC